MNASCIFVMKFSDGSFISPGNDFEGLSYSKLGEKFWNALLSIKGDPNGLPPSIGNIFFLRSNIDKENAPFSTFSNVISVPMNNAVCFPGITFMSESEHDSESNKRRHEVRKLIKKAEVKINIDDLSFEDESELDQYLVENVDEPGKDNSEFDLHIPSDSALADLFEPALTKGQKLRAAQTGFFFVLSPPGEEKTVKISFEGKSKEIPSEPGSHHSGVFHTKAQYTIQYFNPAHKP